MDRFLTHDRLWRAGWTRLHVYLLPDLDVDDGLYTLVDACRLVMARFPFVAPVQPDWLHVTVQMITGDPAAAIAPAQRERLVARLTAAVADVPPFRLTVGSSLASRSAVIADVDGDLPGQPFHEVYTRVRAAITDVLGPQALEYDTLPPHMTLGYATSSGDSGTVQAALRRVRPSHATLAVRWIHLLDVVQDPERSEYRWTPVARIPLGTRTASPPDGGGG